MSFEMHWEKNGVVKRIFGHVTGAEMISAIEQVEADSRFESVRYVINDFLDCTSIAVTVDDVEMMAAIDAAAALTNKRFKVAIVATLPEILPLANSYVTDPLTPCPTKVFSTIADARAWIAGTPV